MFSVNMVFLSFYKNGPTPASFSFIFGLLGKTSLQFLQQINVKKCLVHPVYGAGIRTHNLRNMSLLPLPLDHSMYMFSFPLVVHVSFGHYSFEMACLMLLKFGPNCFSLLAPIFKKNSFPSFLGSFCSSLLKNGPIPAYFCLFSFFSHYNFNTN